MSGIAVKSILIIILLIGILHVYDKNHAHELSIEHAMRPVKHLSDARHALVNNNYARAIQELDQAIIKMKMIEKFADSSSIAHIEQSVKDLSFVEMEIKKDSLVLKDLNKAFFNALNSIAFTCIVISEKNLDKGKKYKAMRFMNASFSKMIASLKFVNTEDLEQKEKKVIRHIREILHNMKESNYEYKFNYDVINHELEELIEL